MTHAPYDWIRTLLLYLLSFLRPHKKSQPSTLLSANIQPGTPSSTTDRQSLHPESWAADKAKFLRNPSLSRSDHRVRRSSVPVVIQKSPEHPARRVPVQSSPLAPRSPTLPPSPDTPSLYSSQLHLSNRPVTPAIRHIPDILAIGPEFSGQNLPPHDSAQVKATAASQVKEDEEANVFALNRDSSFPMARQSPVLETRQFPLRYQAPPTKDVNDHVEKPYSGLFGDVRPALPVIVPPKPSTCTADTVAASVEKHALSIPYPDLFDYGMYLKRSSGFADFYSQPPSPPRRSLAPTFAFGTSRINANGSEPKEESKPKQITFGTSSIAESTCKPPSPTLTSSVSSPAIDAQDACLELPSPSLSPSTTSTSNHGCDPTLRSSSQWSQDSFIVAANRPPGLSDNPYDNPGNAGRPRRVKEFVVAVDVYAREKGERTVDVGSNLASLGFEGARRDVEVC